MLFTPSIQLDTLFIRNALGRIVSTREPNPTPGPQFSLIRGLATCAWAVHADVPTDLARQIDLLAAREEPSRRGWQQAPVYERQYRALLGGIVESGPAFTFPEAFPEDRDVVIVEDLEPLARYFRGWMADELSERAPIAAIVEGCDAVSICFCARKSDQAAEAGVETAEPFRGRGFGPRVTASWAVGIRALGLLPIYSTSWTNSASLSVARQLSLNACASDWNVLASAA